MGPREHAESVEIHDTASPTWSSLYPNCGRAWSGEGVRDANEVVESIYRATEQAAIHAIELRRLSAGPERVRLRRRIAALIAEARSDTKALRKLLGPRAFRISQQYPLLQREDVEDIFQEMFFAVVRTFDPNTAHAPIENVNGYWQTIVHRQCARRVRQLRRVPQSPLGVHDPSDGAPVAEGLVELDAQRSFLQTMFGIQPADALRTLGLLHSPRKLDRCYAVLVLRVDGWTNKELAHLAERPESTIRGWRQFGADHLAERVQRLRATGDIDDWATAETVQRWLEGTNDGDEPKAGGSDGTAVGEPREGEA